MVMMGGYDMGGYDPFMDEMMGGGNFTGILSFLNSWPEWAITLLTILAVIIGGYIVGKIIAKVYTSIRYPDPDKPQVFSAKQKIMFLCVGALVVGMLYYAMKPPAEEPMDDMMGEDGMIYEEDGMMGGVVDNTMPEVEVAVAVPA